MHLLHRISVDERRIFLITEEIPALEIGHIDPKSMLDRYPWHIPEKDVVIISGRPNSQNDVMDFVQTSPDIAWKNWVQLDNSERHYPLDAGRLIALSGFSCFEGSSGVETNLYINSIILAEKDVTRLIDAMSNDSSVSYRVTNPPDWKGGIHARCYITPKEVCWMPWKKRYPNMTDARTSLCFQGFPGIVYITGGAIHRTG